jgi:hypothetical protein
VTDGHPHLTCIGIGDDECGRPIHKSRDYPVYPDGWRCSRCHEKLIARQTRLNSKEIRADEDSQWG